MTVILKIDEDLEKDQVLWRYMDLSKLVYMFEQKGLWLARADKFRDRHEGRFPDEMMSITENAYKGFSDDDNSPVKDADDFQDYLLKNTFISCWHLSEDEDMAMWKLYSKDKKGVAIKTDIQNFKDSFVNRDRNIFAGKIDYIDYENELFYEESDYNYIIKDLRKSRSKTYIH